jgi:hypothetical protein
MRTPGKAQSSRRREAEKGCRAKDPGATFKPTAAPCARHPGQPRPDAVITRPNFGRGICRILPPPLPDVVILSVASRLLFGNRAFAISLATRSRRISLNAVITSAETGVPDARRICARWGGEPEGSAFVFFARPSNSGALIPHHVSLAAAATSPTPFTGRRHSERSVATSFRKSRRCDFRSRREVEESLLTLSSRGRILAEGSAFGRRCSSPSTSLRRECPYADDIVAVPPPFLCKCVF